MCRAQKASRRGGSQGYVAWGVGVWGLERSRDAHTAARAPEPQAGMAGPQEQWHGATNARACCSPPPHVPAAAGPPVPTAWPPHMLDKRTPVACRPESGASRRGSQIKQLQISDPGPCVNKHLHFEWANMWGRAG